MINRRSFLTILAALPIAAKVPWQELIQPRPSQAVSLIDELNRITMAQIYPSIVDNFFTPSPLIDYLRAKG